MVDISNNNINMIDKTTLYFLSNKTYLNKLNNNIINNNDNDIKNDFITYKKPIKNIINKLFEKYITLDSDIKDKNIDEPKKKYEEAFYVFSKLCIQHIKSENINKKINSDLSNYSNYSNFNNINNINIDDSNNNIYIDISYNTKNDDKILFIKNTNNNNMKKYIDIKNNNQKKKILPRRIE